MTAKWQYKQAYEAALEHNHELKAEADRLREHITTQKQTIQSYRDESREWREVADHAQADNAKLRELVKDFFDVPCQCLKCEHYNYEEDRCDLRDRARELGIEVTA